MQIICAKNERTGNSEQFSTKIEPDNFNFGNMRNKFGSKVCGIALEIAHLKHLKHFITVEHV